MSGLKRNQPAHERDKLYIPAGKQCPSTKEDLTGISFSMQRETL